MFISFVPRSTSTEQQPSPFSPRLNISLAVCFMVTRWPFTPSWPSEKGVVQGCCDTTTSQHYSFRLASIPLSARWCVLSHSRSPYFYSNFYFRSFMLFGSRCPSSTASSVPSSFRRNAHEARRPTSLLHIGPIEHLSHRIGCLLLFGI